MQLQRRISDISDIEQDAINTYDKRSDISDVEQVIPQPIDLVLVNHDLESSRSNSSLDDVLSRDSKGNLKLIQINKLSEEDIKFKRMKKNLKMAFQHYCLQNDYMTKIKDFDDMVVEQLNLSKFILFARDFGVLNNKQFKITVQQITNMFRKSSDQGLISLEQFYDFLVFIAGTFKNEQYKTQQDQIYEYFDKVLHLDDQWKCMERMNIPQHVIDQKKAQYLARQNNGGKRRSVSVPKPVIQSKNRNSMNVEDFQKMFIAAQDIKKQNEAEIQKKEQQKSQNQQQLQSKSPLQKRQLTQNHQKISPKIDQEDENFAKLMDTKVETDENFFMKDKQKIVIDFSPILKQKRILKREVKSEPNARKIVQDVQDLSPQIKIVQSQRQFDQVKEDNQKQDSQGYFTPQRKSSQPTYENMELLKQNYQTQKINDQISLIQKQSQELKQLQQKQLLKSPIYLNQDNNSPQEQMILRRPKKLEISEVQSSSTKKSLILLQKLDIQQKKSPSLNQKIKEISPDQQKLSPNVNQSLTKIRVSPQHKQSQESIKTPQNKQILIKLKSPKIQNKQGQNSPSLNPKLSQDSPKHNLSQDSLKNSKYKINQDNLRSPSNRNKQIQNSPSHQGKSNQDNLRNLQNIQNTDRLINPRNKQSQTSLKNQQRNDKSKSPQNKNQKSNLALSQLKNVQMHHERSLSQNVKKNEQSGRNKSPFKSDIPIVNRDLQIDIELMRRDFEKKISQIQKQQKQYEKLVQQQRKM